MSEPERIWINPRDRDFVYYEVSFDGAIEYRRTQKYPLGSQKAIEQAIADLAAPKNTLGDEKASVDQSASDAKVLPPTVNNELLEAAKRSLNWLSSYPGESAMSCYDQMRRAIQNAESIASPSAPVSGWKLVPIEPTEEMLCDGQEAVLFCYRERLSSEDCDHSRAAWKAMLEAAPQEPA